MIVRMKRITLVAHKADEANVLKALQSTSAVQVIDAAQDALDEQTLAQAEDHVQKLDDALNILKPFAAKKGFLTPKPEATLQQIQKEMPGALGLSDELAQISHELSKKCSEMDQNETVIETLRPWEAFPADMQRYQNSKTVRYFTGFIGVADADKLNEIETCSEYQFFGEGNVRACVVACPIEEAKAVAGFLKSLDWTDYVFPKLPGTPAQAINRLTQENHALEEKKNALAQLLSEKAAGVVDTVAGAYDAAVIERDRTKAAVELARTFATFQLEGWVPEDRVSEVKTAVVSVTDAYSLTVRDPNEDEVPPSVVENNKFATPFEQVTNLYSRPDPNGIDATPYMAPFYVLLFGLMLSDSGYGLVLALGCALYIRFKQPTGMSGGFAKVLFWGGLSTIVWGVLVGTVFGMDFDALLGTKDLFPLLVDPMSDPISMLILCFGLGVLHIFFGIGLKMKISFARHDWQTAIFDNFSWILIIVGLIGLAFPITKTVGMVMAIIGALMILVFKGRGKKNPFSRTISGLGELYQVTSFLSDILSYARLFALGIATGVIASVFNDLCIMLTGSPNIILKILGILVAVALLLALHAFNIGINTLGAFVHCARLQYVEFYGKFYESGGMEFKPLGYRTKHVRIIDAEK
ncbi:MAG: V-type ATP synthase subunit I [Clostridia bacterium]